LEKLLRSPLFLPVALLVLTLGMFGDVLFSTKHTLLSHGSTDVAEAFVYWRDFGFRQLRQGHVPLWDPHVFSGAPFVGGWQTALFYPLNAIYLILPLDKAIDLEIVLHVYLTGLFTAWWVARYGLHPLAMLLAATMVMFGGPFFLHIFAGHLAPIDAMAWVPLLLLVVDHLLERPQAKWVLLGIAALAMQLLAGHPQTVFNTAITLTLYGAFRLPKATEKRRTVWALGSMCLLAFGITAVQVLTGLDASAEGTRQGAVPYAFASAFSFPPENFLTWLMPDFFGDMMRMPYWGRCYLWEMSLFVGVTGITLSLYGALYGQAALRKTWIGMAALLLCLALAAHTPLFPLLYHAVPGFSKFRGHSKFIYEATLFLALLAACGLDQLLKSPRHTLRVAACLAALALLIGVLGIALYSTTVTSGEVGAWEKVVVSRFATGESYLKPEFYRSTLFLNQARSFAALQCLIAAGVLVVLAALFRLLPSVRRLGPAIAILGIVELCLFARSTIATFDLADTRFPEVDAYLAAHPGDYRILQLAVKPNNAIVANSYDIWGYDPAVLKRYAEFMTSTQGGKPDEASDDVPFNGPHPLYSMLRCRFNFTPGPQGIGAAQYRTVLPHVLLVNRYERIPNRDRIFAAMSARAFDPAQTAILETSPDPAPVESKEMGSVRLVGSTTDSLTIEAEAPHPSLLLITDAYSRGWRAVALPGSSQQHYEVLPANYILRAIPLAAGRHTLRVEYAPRGYEIGKVVSLTSILIYLGLLMGYGRRRAAFTRGLPVAHADV
jgi:hypothetical protein